MDVLRVDRPLLADRGLERHERRAEHHVDAVGRREPVEERERLGRALEHLPVAGDQLRAHRPPFRNRSDAGKLPALEQLERRTAARRNPRDAVGEAELLDRADGVAATDDGVRVRGCHRLGDRARAGGEPAPLEHAHRAVPEDRPCLADDRRRTPRPWRARCRDRASPPGSRRPWRPAPRRPRRTQPRRRRRPGSSTGNESGLCSRTCSAILPPIRTRSARPPRFSSTASLSSTLAPPAIEHEGMLDLAEQPAEVVELREQQQPRVGRQEVRHRLGRAVRAMGRAERVVDVEVVAVGELARVPLVVLRLARVEARVLEHAQPVVRDELAQAALDGRDRVLSPGPPRSSGAPGASRR